MTIRLIQIQHGTIRRIGLIEEPYLRLLASHATIYDLALSAIREARRLTQLARNLVTDEKLEYDQLYENQSDWRILPAADHPLEPSRCLVTGTGLTHMASAKNRDVMHQHSEELTDSMKMFQWGIAGGRPADETVGIAPEWFYKGQGDILCAHNDPLIVPPYAEDGGEEPEIAGVYIIGPNGQPYRLGFAVGNEFSDHKFERRNYLYLSGSKLRDCALGPELVLNHEFKTVTGTVAIMREEETLWSHAIRSGEEEMCHSLRNIEHHHFKYAGHRRPGDVHIHFFGADAFSFGAGVELADGDVMEIAFEGFGRALRNSVKIDRSEDHPVSIIAL